MAPHETALGVEEVLSKSFIASIADEKLKNLPRRWADSDSDLERSFIDREMSIQIVRKQIRVTILLSISAAITTLTTAFLGITATIY